VVNRANLDPHHPAPQGPGFLLFEEQNAARLSVNGNWLYNEGWANNG
jgi:hypothetical protein